MAGVRMIWLLLVSFIWAFSFGLIKGRLTGVDPSLVAWLRVTLALVVLGPWLRPRCISGRAALLLGGIGAVQFGLMYVGYIAAFRTLAAYEVAALTIFTPIFVAGFHALLSGRLHWPIAAAAALAVAGAGVIVVDKPLAAVSWSGVLLIQGSNACFALGQVAWQRWSLKHPEVRADQVFGFLYAGAVLAALPFAAGSLPALASLTVSESLTIAYLGVVASGIGFFLWNLGAAGTHPGALAVLNNVKIPLGVACSVWIFGETGNLPRLAAGSLAILLAGVIAELGVRRTRS